eukprot:gene1812-1980_t
MSRLSTAMLEHDKKMEAQRAALLASHEVSVSKEKEVLAEQLRAVHHQAVEKEILRKLSDFPSKRRSSHGNSPIECCVERCGRWVMEAQAAYGERKQSAALLSMQSEIEHITRSVSQVRITVILSVTSRNLITPVSSNYHEQ